MGQSTFVKQLLKSVVKLHFHHMLAGNDEGANHFEELLLIRAAMQDVLCVHVVLKVLLCLALNKLKSVLDI